MDLRKFINRAARVCKWSYSAASLRSLETFAKKMSITLYKAAEDLRSVLDQVDTDTGEMSDAYVAARSLVETKAASVVAYILSQEREQRMAQDAVSDIEAQIGASKRRSQSLRKMLADHMAALGITKITGAPMLSASLQVGRDVSVDVFDPAQLPVWCMSETTTVAPNKALIRTALEDGLDVPGARLAPANRLTLKG